MGQLLYKGFHPKRLADRVDIGGGPNLQCLKGVIQINFELLFIVQPCPFSKKKLQDREENRKKAGISTLTLRCH
jgi:hypothetical protein